MKIIILVILLIIGFDSLAMQERCNLPINAAAIEFKKDSTNIAPQKTKSIVKLSIGQRISYYIRIALSLFLIAILIMLMRR